VTRARARWLLVAALLLAAHASRADVTVRVGGGDLRPLVERVCRLLRAQTLSTQLLRLLAAKDVNNGKEGWSGALADPRFAGVTAFGDYDRGAVSHLLSCAKESTCSRDRRASSTSWSRPPARCGSRRNDASPTARRGPRSCSFS
jgi:hypothetical protein